MEFHPIASIFPMLPDEALQRLADDIRENGLRDSVTLFEGKVLDGRNRATACLLAGVTPTTVEFQGTYLDAVAYVWSTNFHRRHLNAGQAAVAEVERTKLVEQHAAAIAEMKAEAAKRMAQAKGKPQGVKSPHQLIGEETEAHGRQTSDIRAKAAGTNRRYLEAAEDLLERAPEKLEAVKKGEKTLSQVMREVKQEEVKQKLATLPNDKFRVVYADPPWNYGNAGVIGDSDNYGHAERHYPAMTIAELCAMDIKSIVEDNAVLFLWVTSPLLDECFPVIKAWGFDYKTSFVWDKVKHNFGHYNSVRHEFLLVCTRGSCTPDEKKLYDSVISVERTEKHSEKPEEFRAIIDTLYTHGKRIELFARQRAEGWECYGNEC